MIATGFLSMWVSNTATTLMMLPIALSIIYLLEDSFKKQEGMSDKEIANFSLCLTLALPATVAASCAFMLPVATPPNAVVFGSNRITLPQMAKAGLVLNLITFIVIALLIFTVGNYVFDLNL